MKVGTMKVGAVVFKNGESFVITKMENGKVTRTTPLRDYLARVVLVKHDGEYDTIENTLTALCLNYIGRNDVVFIDENGEQELIFKEEDKK